MSPASARVYVYVVCVYMCACVYVCVRVCMCVCMCMCVLSHQLLAVAGVRRRRLADTVSSTLRVVQILTRIPPLTLGGGYDTVAFVVRVSV